MSTIKALKVLLGFKVRVVQTYEPPIHKTLVYHIRRVPIRYRLPVALKVLRNNPDIDHLAGFYAMQVLTSETERRALLAERYR